MTDGSSKDSKVLTDYAQMIFGLHSRWKPHPGQIPIGRALLQDEVKQIFAKCGRNFGKTDLICYLLWRYAQSNPNSENYYFAPLAKQAREIIWASRRLQDFGPRDWLQPSSKGINNSDLRLRFTNGAFIKLDGSDNVEAYRGVKPRGLTVYDEFKDFKPEFHEAMDPNYAAYDSPLIIIGTPPPIEDHHFYHTEDEFRRNEFKAYFEFTSFENPYIPRKVLEAKKNDLYAKGEGDVWEREYMVRKVFGGKNSIFPMLNYAHIKTHRQILQLLYRDRKKLKWAVAADPGSATCFAVLFAALNPYTKTLYLVDEIYETNQKKTTVAQIAPQIYEKINLHSPHTPWDKVYDEAASWFQNEMIDQFDDAFMPAPKSVISKEEGLSLIKTLLLDNKVVISDKCPNLFWEMRNYVKDKNNKIPKVNDHLIDALRYILHIFYYSIVEEKEPLQLEEINKEKKRFFTPDEDFKRVDVVPSDEFEF